MTRFLAQSLGTFNYPGALGNVISGPNATIQFTNTLSKIIGFLTVVAGLWFMFQLIIGAFNWLSAGGDKQHLDTAKKRITNAVIGLFLVIVSFAFFAVVGAFFGLDVLNLSNTIDNLAP